MKKILLPLYLLLFSVCQGQKIYFPAKEAADPVAYETAMSKLAEASIPLYSNPKKYEFFDGLFRLQFAKGDYIAVSQYLDSTDVYSKMDKQFFKIPGFHYRTYSMARLAAQSEPANDFKTAYANAFSKLYNGFPDAGKDQVRSVFETADIEGEKNEFIALLKTYQATGADSISLNEAVALTRQWNYWKVFSTTKPLAMAQFEQMDKAAAKDAKEPVVDPGAVVSPSAKTIIKNVTLLDVEKQKLIPNAMVTITGSTITAIDTKNKTTIPADATIIDGTGKFLMPGMTDAHVHFSQSGGLYTRPDAINLTAFMPYEKDIQWGKMNMQDALKRYVQNGITNVIDVGSTPNYLQLREKYSGKTYAPSVYMTGPLLTSYEPPAFKKYKEDSPFWLVTNPDDGRKMVKQQLPFHPDFIKIWYIVLGNNKEEQARKFLPTAKAIIEEAHANNLKVAVHAMERITAQLAVEAGCDFLVHSVTDEVITPEFVKLLKDKNVTLCPTLVVHDGYIKTFTRELNFTGIDLLKANPEQLGSLFDLRHIADRKLADGYKASYQSNKAVFKAEDSISLINLKKLVDAGVRIAAGTDAGNIGTLHAASFQHELNAMKSSGMSNWQVLQSATINPAFILGKEKENGSISVGKKADMILLNANPLDNLDNLQKLNLVINKGHIISPDTLIKETALALVERQLNAYNQHNLEAFLEPYADDVEIYDFPNSLSVKGKTEMQKQYTFLSKVPNLHCEIKQRIIQGNTIIDKESVTGFGNKPIEATAIYVIENNKIKKVYFVTGN